ncbi:MAG: cobyrinic acid a,c-diamide synthase [Desulforhopalus sp.]|jgi:cobyrinic acid a,c-diamide synthase
MTATVPACVISGTSSGSGKTTITLGLMAAFKQRGFRVQPYKCGPDFIDPGLHELVTGVKSRNLDLWMSGEEHTRHCFQTHLENSDIALIEGVMGMFDGGISSSGELSKQLGIANILVLDVRSMADSAAAIVKGFETYSEGAEVKGVILNNIASERHLQLVSDAIKNNCKAEILGYLPRNLDFSIPSRHLGLLTGDEAPISDCKIDLLAKTITEHIDLDRVLELCTRFSPAKQVEAPALETTPACRIAIARDKAFCFYYEDNFDILRNRGAELVFFSPLNDKKLPENIHGIYLGGGYPELYAKELSANTEMLQEIRSWVEGDGVVYAECGGFMYLTQGIVDHDSQQHSLVGAFPAVAAMQTKRASLGYREVTTCERSCFGPENTILRGHEFHYSNIGKMDSLVPRIYKVNNGSREGYNYRRVLGGYMHLHFGYSPEVATAFINYCRE